LQEERKRDVEETADFVKQVITQGKQEWQRECVRLEGLLERVRRESMTAEGAARVMALLEAKVDIREVQQALNECQGDIREQLLDFRAAVANE
jgi:hypothetical protein